MQPSPKADVTGPVAPSLQATAVARIEGND
jgi:hypothetical protein